MPALRTLNKVLNDKALTDAQRVKALTLKARRLIEPDQVAEGEAAVQELLIKYPKPADAGTDGAAAGQGEAAQCRNASPRAWRCCRSWWPNTPDTASGIAAQYELLAFDLGQGVDGGEDR